MKRLLLCLLILVSFIPMLNAQTFEWAHQIGGAGDEQSLAGGRLLRNRL